jgi:hypothetical protein
MGLSLFNCQRTRTPRTEGSESIGELAQSAVLVVEPTGLEPVTSGLQSQRSPN